MKVVIDGKEQEFDDIADLEDAIDEVLDNVRENAYSDGLEDGKDIGFDEGTASIDIPEPDPRAADLRLSLYRAIYAGDIEAAEDAMNLMAMVDIDRDLIWQAKGMERG